MYLSRYISTLSLLVVTTTTLEFEIRVIKCLQPSSTSYPIISNLFKSHLDKNWADIIFGSFARRQRPPQRLEPVNPWVGIIFFTMFIFYCDYNFTRKNEYKK